MELMGSNSPFPVVDERPLGPVQRRLLGARRELSQLPVQRPGTALVFASGSGMYRVYREDRHLKGTEDAVVSAVSVSVVDLRERSIWVELTIPSASPADDFMIRVCFRCRVTSPERVAEAGLTDVATLLRHHLAEDSSLMMYGLRYSVERLNEFRRLVLARLESSVELNPPFVDGVALVMSAVDVTTPEQLRAHERRLRDGRWGRQATTEDAEWVEQWGDRGARALDALAVARGESSVDQVAARAHQVESERERIALETLRMLHENKLLDRIPVDATRLVDSVIERVTGVSVTIDPADRPEAITGGADATADEFDDLDDITFVPEDGRAVG